MLVFYKISIFHFEGYMFTLLIYQILSLETQVQKLLYFSPQIFSFKLKFPM